jgi:hypothetical protein
MYLRGIQRKIVGVHGILVSKSGIQANPEKIEAIRNMRTPQTKRYPEAH